MFQKNEKLDTNQKSIDVMISELKSLVGSKTPSTIGTDLSSDKHIAIDECSEIYFTFHGSSNSSIFESKNYSSETTNIVTTKSERQVNAQQEKSQTKNQKNQNLKRDKIRKMVLSKIIDL